MKDKLLRASVLTVEMLATVFQLCKCYAGFEFSASGFLAAGF